MPIMCSFVWIVMVRSSELQSHTLPVVGFTPERVFDLPFEVPATLASCLVSFSLFVVLMFWDAFDRIYKELHRAPRGDTIPDSAPDPNDAIHNVSDFHRLKPILQSHNSEGVLWNMSYIYSRCRVPTRDFGKRRCMYQPCSHSGVGRCHSLFRFR